MTTENRKKLIFCISETGSQGKSYIASGIGDELRNRHNKECSVYLLDNMDGSKQTYNRLCYRVNGKEQEVQEARNGVYIIDVLNQDKKNTGIEDNGDAIIKFKETLHNDSEFTLYDFPGQSYSWLENLFAGEIEINEEKQEGELGTVLKQTNKDIYIVVPIVEKKSLASLQKLLTTFNFDKNVYGNLADNVNIVAVYNNILKSTDLTFDEFKNTDEVRQCKNAFGDRFFLKQLQHLDPNYLEKINFAPYSNFYDAETNNPMNVPDGVDPINFGLFIRKVVKSGFMPIVRQVFIEGKK